MIKVMQFTCLKLHHTGEQVFAPVNVGGAYQLQSSLSVLCGKRGNVFTFTSWVTAKAWLDDNLAKVAKSGKTKEDFILDLIIENNQSPQPYLAAEIETIEARNAGDWSVYFADELLENFELGYYVAAGGGGSPPVVSGEYVSNEVLIGQVDVTGMTLAVMANLDLTPYKKLRVEYDGVSQGSGTQECFAINDGLLSQTSYSHSSFGRGEAIINLSNGFMQAVNIPVSAGYQSLFGWFTYDCGLRNTSNFIAIKTASLRVMDSGLFKIFGVL